MGDLAYPLVSDLKREISQKYQVLNPDGVALRGLFIIDKEVRGLATVMLSVEQASQKSCTQSSCWTMGQKHAAFGFREQAA